MNPFKLKLHDEIAHVLNCDVRTAERLLKANSVYCILKGVEV